MFKWYILPFLVFHFYLCLYFIINIRYMLIYLSLSIFELTTLLLLTLYV